MEKRDHNKYPQDLRNSFEIAHFASYAALDIDNYIQFKNGDKTREEFFDPVAIRRLGCLLEEEAKNYFDSRDKGSNAGSNSMGFIEYMVDIVKDYCRTNKVDELNLQAYLGGKELQRFEDFDIKKLKELRDFTIELSRGASAHAYRYSPRRGLVA